MRLCLALRLPSDDHIITEQKKWRIKKNHITYWFLGLVLLVIVGYVSIAHGSSQPSTHKSVVIGIGPQLVDNSNNLGVSVFRRENLSPKSNVLISPPGLSMAVSLLDRIKVKLDSKTSINAQRAYQTLVYYINSLFPSDLIMKNGLWIKRDYVVGSGFAGIAKRYYQTNIQIAGNGSSALTSINQWLDIIGNGQLLRMQPFQSGVGAYMLSASIFQPKWSFGFNSSLSKLSAFYSQGSNPTQVNFMNQEGVFNYYRNNSLQVVELPIGPNQNQSMDILAPDNIGVFLNSLSWGELSNIFKQLNPNEVNLSIPAFSIKSVNAFSIQPGTKTLISNSIGGSPYATGVYQDSLVNISGGGYSKPSDVASNSQAVTMTVNKPFVFVARDNTTGLVLFIGSVYLP